MRKIVYSIMQSDNPMSFLKKAPVESYKPVYRAWVVTENSDDELLEYLFDKFNNDHPHDFTGHSLSVGDIVVMLYDEEQLTEVAYMCDMLGWIKLYTK